MWTWKDVGTIHIGSTSGDTPCSKLALFDMDGCLINTKSGKTHPINKDDWVFFATHVPEQLKDLKAKGFRVIVVSNQKGISTGTTTAANIRSKIQAWSKLVGIEMSAVYATHDDKNRKPDLGMWHYIRQTLNPVPINMAESVALADSVLRGRRCWAARRGQA